MSRLSNPVEALAASVYHAAHTALPDYHYEMVDYEAVGKLGDEDRKAARAREAKGEKALPRKVVTHRPDVSQCEVVAMFGQTWGSAGLGFGGISGQAVTDAYTVVIEGPGGHHAVYWGGQFAYLIDSAAKSSQQRDAFKQDLQAGRTAARDKAWELYGATRPTQDGNIPNED